MFRTDLEHITPDQALEILLPRSGHLIVRVKDLEPGFYNIAGRTKEGRVSYVSGVQVEQGSQVRDCAIRLAPGSKLRIHYNGTAEYIQYPTRAPDA